MEVLMRRRDGKLLNDVRWECLRGEENGLRTQEQIGKAYPGGQTKKEARDRVLSEGHWRVSPDRKRKMVVIARTRLDYRGNGRVMYRPFRGIFQKIKRTRKADGRGTQVRGTSPSPWNPALWDQGLLATSHVDTMEAEVTHSNNGKGCWCWKYSALNMRIQDKWESLA